MAFSFRTIKSGHGHCDDQDQLVLTNEDGAEIVLTFTMGADDNVPLLFIDTPELPEDGDGPILRVRLNDEPVWQNPVVGVVG